MRRFLRRFPYRICHGENIGLSACEGNGDRHIVTAYPEGVSLGDRFKAPDKAVDPPVAGLRPGGIGGVIEDGLESEVIEAPAEDPPGAAIHKGPNDGDYAIPEEGQRKDY